MKKESRSAEEPIRPEGEKITENIRLGPDGVYRWYYEMKMLKNPTILITVYKVLGLSFGIVFLFSLVMSLLGGNLIGWQEFWGLARGFIILFLVFLVIGAVAYLIVAATFGWKYRVLFEMTDDSIIHIQLPAQVEKAQKLGMITAAVGALAHKPTTVGAGMLAASKTTSTSEFANVRYVKVRRWRHTIHVNYLLDKNQVYAEEPDFDFVERFIRARCVNAKFL